MPIYFKIYKEYNKTIMWERSRKVKGGMEVLLRVGIDMVNMNGDEFELFVAIGE